jgi:hypothetical protein
MASSLVFKLPLICSKKCTDPNMEEREGGLFLLVARKDPPGVPRGFFLQTLDIINVNGVALLVLV